MAPSPPLSKILRTLLLKVYTYNLSIACTICISAQCHTLAVFLVETLDIDLAPTQTMPCSDFEKIQ